MTSVPFRTTVEDGKLVVPDDITEKLDLEEGDVVSATITLDSGDVPAKEEL